MRSAIEPTISPVDVSVTACCSAPPGTVDSAWRASSMRSKGFHPHSIPMRGDGDEERGSVSASSRDVSAGGGVYDRHSSSWGVDGSRTVTEPVAVQLRLAVPAPSTEWI